MRVFLKKRLNSERIGLTKCRTVRDGKTKFKSTVLRKCIGENHKDCRICLYINGDRSEETMLEVIEYLDWKLADRENYLRQLQGKNNCMINIKM